MTLATTDRADKEAEPVLPASRGAVAVRMQAVRKAFGDRIALDGADLSVAWGEVHALLGENGAGKSSLMNILAGFYGADDGLIEVDGAPAAFAEPKAASAAGIGMIHQHFKLVGPLTVLENLRLACGRKAGWTSNEAALSASQAMAQDLGFVIPMDVRVDQLSVSEQQKVEILKVLLGGARILIMDEPTAVLAESEAAGMLELARRLADDGRAVILITHKLRDVSATADRVTVMRAGKTVIDGAPARGLSAAELARAMVGGETAVVRRGNASFSAQVVLELKGVGTPAAEHDVPLRDLNLRLHKGEILGVAGLGGNGQSELLETIIGLRAPTHGDIIMHGETAPVQPADRREAGLRFVPADRFHLGLFGSLSLAENLAVPALSGRRPEKRYWVTKGWMRGRAEGSIRDYEIAGGVADTQARLLSGGNAQKLILAREFEGDFSILIVHSPVRGLDVRAAAAVQNRLLAAAARGVGVLMISEDLDEVLALSSRVAVLSHGRLSDAMPIEQTDRAELGRLILEGH
ncbi:ABC transporter ATP-binding protein [Acidisoma cellulosilytica]|uniref:ABC transporter ATP-binding protein n=1 Tax=Acidisoma cellulosilyticum TaxID=2802395 RepID=A0A963Z141_9PROT|nr:ABC transporter ATP-binding protein [Acidisoma cellulosilyticum]MCB8879920.1 ABC transporter ATP-binding protein [Acidisoma cellulosilyticum]